MFYTLDIYSYIQLYTNLGLNVKNVHKVLEFNQSPWLKQYIDSISQKRGNTDNS